MLGGGAAISGTPGGGIAMRLSAVIKVGGSLSRGLGLPALCGEISRLGVTYPLLLVPGGGDFADQVREVARRFDVGNTAAHWMALLAMDQYGFLLNQLIPESCLTADIAYACESAGTGRVSILLPFALMMKEDPLPHSWDVTSDTIAAWVSHRTASSRLVLLKDVDGLFVPGGVTKDITVEDLKSHAGGVDVYLANFLTQASIETWVINGLRPERLAELLNTGRTTGTKIIP